MAHGGLGISKVVVFAPHPDDEILGCGGVIAKRLDEGYDVFVIFMTDGRNALRDLGIFSKPSPPELMRIRKEEAKRAAKVLGIHQENLIFLDIEDGTLGKNERIAQKKATQVLRKLSPEEIYFPQEKEFNIDHKVTNRLVRNGISQLCYDPVEYQYAIAWSYPFNLLVRVHPTPLRDLIISKLFKYDAIYVDVSNFLTFKKEALKEYQSQLNILSHSQRRPILTESFLKRFLNSEEEFLVEKQPRKFVIKSEGKS
jgi:LmbE family N-acetylglucosaminyl deacetylase